MQRVVLIIDLVTHAIAQPEIKAAIIPTATLSRPRYGYTLAALTDWPETIAPIT